MILFFARKCRHHSDEGKLPCTTLAYARVAEPRRGTDREAAPRRPRRVRPASGERPFQASLGELRQADVGNLRIRGIGVDR